MGSNQDQEIKVVAVPLKDDPLGPSLELMASSVGSAGPSKQQMMDAPEFSNEYVFNLALYTKYDSFDELFDKLPIYRFEVTTQAPTGLDSIQFTDRNCLTKSIFGPCICATGVGGLYLCCKRSIIEQGHLGFARNINADVETYGVGVHWLFSCCSSMSTFSVAEKHIVFGSQSRTQNMTSALRQIIRVDAGEFGLIMQEGEPIQLQQGTHLIMDSRTLFHGFHMNTSKYVTLANFHYITVSPENVGFGESNGNTVLLKPGTHVIRDSLFRFLGEQSLSMPVVSMQSIKIVQVQPNYLIRATSTSASHRLMLESGVHLLVSMGWEVLPDPIPLTIKSHSFRLENIRTADLVEVSVEAEMTYIVAAPKLLQSSGIWEFDDFLTSTGCMALADMISNSTLSGGSAGLPDVPEPPTTGETEKLEAPEKDDVMHKDKQVDVFDRLHDQLHLKLGDHGISLIALRITQYNIINAEVAMAVASKATITAQTEAKRANVKSESLVHVAEAEASARVLNISSVAQASARVREAKSAADAEIARAEGYLLAAKKLGGDELATKLAVLGAGSSLYGDKSKIIVMGPNTGNVMERMLKMEP